MTASESENGGSGRGKSLAWHSRNSKDVAPTVGRDVGSESGRDIGRNLANWWTSAVEQTSTFLMDEVPATFAGLSVGAKELKPTLQRGTSFSTFSLGWKVSGEASKGAVEVPKREEDEVPEGSRHELPKKSPSLRLERSLERSRSRKQMGMVRSPSLSSPKPLEKLPHRSTEHLEKVQVPSTSSPKQLASSPHRTMNHVEKMQEPKQPKRSPLRTMKHVEKMQETSAWSPNRPERSPQSITKHGKKYHEPSPKSFKWLPLTATKREESKSPATETPSKVSPGKPSKSMAKSPLRSGKSALSASEISTYSGSSPPKAMKSSPWKSSKHVEVSSLETPKPSPIKATKHAEKSPPSTPKTPGMPSEISNAIATDPRSSSRTGESRRRTKRMQVDMTTSDVDASPAHAVTLSTVSQEFLLGEGIIPGSAGVQSLEVLQRQQFWTPQKARTDSPDRSNPGSSTRRVDGSGLGSRNRTCSSRSLARSLYIDETAKQHSPKLTAVGTPDSCDKAVVQPHKNGVVLPIEEIFPGKTNSLPQIRVRTLRIVEMSSDLINNTVIGGSTRVPQRNLQPQSRLSGSLPSSPRRTPGESRTARLLRKLKFTGRGSGAGSDDAKLGKRRASTKVQKAMTDVVPRKSSNLHREFSEPLEPRKLDFSYRSWTDPNLGETVLKELETAMNNRADQDPASGALAERTDVQQVDSEASQRSVKKLQQDNSSSETSEKASSAWPWSFKWKWGSKSRSNEAKGAAKACNVPEQQLPSAPGQKTDEFSSPTADIMSDARDVPSSQSDRFSTGGRADKLACDRAPKHRRVLSWGAGTTSSLCSGSNPAMTAFTPSQPRLPTRDAQELLLPPRKLLVPPSVNVLRESQEQVVLAEGKPSNPANVFRGSAESDVFEDCSGSFHGTGSPSKSSGSFKSTENSNVSGASARKTARISIDEDERNGQGLSLCRQEIQSMAGCNEDPCTSTSQFVYKCPKVQEFNQFLKAQKDRLRSGLDAGSTDRFHIVLTGRDLELSSIVAAMSYAWLQENSFPTVSGDTWYPVPVINIPRQQMDKHKDAVWLLDACGIDAGFLLFADEAELSTLVAAGRIKMSTVGQDVLVTENEVGSVCTLLMEMLLAGNRGLLQPRYMKAFMLAGILLDTDNLDFASMRDTEMSNFLVEGMGSFGRTNFCNRLREAYKDVRVSKLVTQHYIDNQPSARLKRAEAEHEHSDRDSVFTPSQDQTSTSEAGTNSSMDEYSPRPKLRQSTSFRYSRLPPHSAPAKSHRLSLPGGCMDQDAQAVAHIRKAATQCSHPNSALPSYKTNHHREKSSAFARIRKNLFFAG